jgi:alpha-1,3-rhamnosyl/mannosyltransferase
MSPTVILDARTITAHFPGIGRYTYELARHLPAAAPDWQFIFAINPAQRIETRFDIPALAQPANARLRDVTPGVFSWQEQLALPRQLTPANLVHFPYYIRPYLVPRPTVTTVYDIISHLYPAYLPSPWHRAIFELTTRLTLARSRHILTLSVSAADDLRRVYGVDPRRITVTPAAADPRFQPVPPDEVAALRQRLNLPASYVLFVGSNKPHKNLPTLIQAWSHLKSTLHPPTSNLHPPTSNLQPPPSNLQLLLAGREDPRYTGVRQAIVEAGLDGDVRVLGAVAETDLPALYSGATLCVLPSLYEGFGLPLLEAMACGTAVVCSKTSSLPEVVGKEAGLLFDPTDARDMAAVIARALTEPGLLDHLRSQAHQRAREFTWQRTAEQTIAAYERVL